MNDSIEQLLPFVTKASRYLGNEINAVKKDPAAIDMTFALAFPDAYEVGMSHLGLQILYHVLNSQPAIACERAFAPWTDMEAEMKAAGLELATLESDIPLRQCDIVGFSLEYELCYATVLRMLALARIPLKACDRDASWPLVIGGGPSAYNPEPVAEFFDAFVIGEGEEVLPELCRAYLDWKRSGKPKAALLDALAELQGIYVPSFFNVGYNADGTIAKVTSLKKGYESVTKRIVTGFTGSPWCTHPIVPHMQVIHDRAGIEIARGCTRGCRFCMAGMVYRPVREKGAARLRELCRDTLAGTGYEELGLLSLSSGDYCGIQSLLSSLIRDHGGNKVAVSLPSLRVESLTSGLMEQIKQIRKTGFTIAPEAGTQRLRDVINKGFTDDEILATAERIFAAGWNLVKLYFMIGLPTETMDDVEGIIELCRKIARLDRRKNVNVSISTFVPKPHTPFQWEVQEDAAGILRKQHYIKDALRSRNLQVKYHDHRLSLLEGVFSRGDRRLAAVLVQAAGLGAGYDAWTEHFDSAVWDRAFRQAGIAPEYYLRAISPGEMLPWKHISCGVGKDYLLQEREKALRGETTADCRSGECTGCGVCASLEARIEINRDTPAAEPPAAAEKEASPQVPTFRYRLTHEKTGPARFLSHLEFTGVLARAMRRAELPLKYSQGFHPMPRLAFHEALPVGMETMAADCYIEFTEPVAAGAIVERLNPQLPQGVKIVSVEENVLKSRGAADTIKIYRLTFPEQQGLSFPDRQSTAANIAEFLSRESCSMPITKKGRTVEADLRKIVIQLSMDEAGDVIMMLDTAAGILPRVADIAGAVFSLGERQRKALRIVLLPADAAGRHER